MNNNKENKENYTEEEIFGIFKKEVINVLKSRMNISDRVKIDIDINMEDLSIEDLGLEFPYNSDLFFSLKKRFGIKILDRRLKKLLTVKDCLALIKLEIKSKIYHKGRIFNSAKEKILSIIDNKNYCIEFDSILDNIDPSKLNKSEIIYLMHILKSEFYVTVLYGEKSMPEFKTVRDIVNYIYDGLEM